MDNFKWLFGKSSLFYGVDEKILRQNLNSLTNKSDIKEASQIAYDLADKIIQWMIVPRTSMVGIIILMGLFLPFIYFYYYFIIDYKPR